MPNLKNREDWLQEAVRSLRPWFAELEVQPPRNIQISVGVAPGRTKSTQVGWTCPPNWTSTGDWSNIFISPVRDEPVKILGTTLHEMIHAADECLSGHKGRFVRMWSALGYVGKPTTSELGPDLYLRLVKVAEELGPYPHVLVAPLEMPRVQKTYMRLIRCDECGWMCRTTAKHIEVGLPTCPCGNWTTLVEA